MSTPPTRSPIPTASRLDTSLSSLPSHSHSTLSATKLLPSTNLTQSFSVLSPEPIRNVQASSSGSTVGKLRASACARNRTDSYPPVTLAYDAGHGNTRRFVLLSPASAGSLNSSPTLPVVPTPHHHDDSELFTEPTLPAQKSSSPLLSFHGPPNQYSYSHHCLLNEHLHLHGDATPPNGAPRGWWSRSPASPDTHLLVSAQESPLLPIFDSAEREYSHPPSHEDQDHLPLFSNLPSLFYEDIPIRQLDAGNIHTKNEDALVLPCPQHHPSTSSTAHKRTLKSLGIGIEEDRRNVEIQHSFWPRLLGRSPKPPPKPPIGEVVINATSNETMPQVEDDHVVSMEDWDGKSLRVAPLGVSLGLLSPEKVKITASSQAMSSASLGKRSTSPGKGTGEKNEQIALPRELPVPKLPAHSQTRYDRFAFPLLHRDGAKGRERDCKAKERWLRARENVSLALNAILPTSELAQLSETGRGFATEGEAARVSAGSSRVEKTTEPETKSTEREVRTSGKLWLTVKSTVTTVSPVLRTSLSVLGDVSQLTPIPGLHEAAHMLLAVWEAVDCVETNRTQCLRLTERCATAIFSVRAEIADAERDMKSQPGARGDGGLVEEMRCPVGKLNECVGMVYDFLIKLNRRPFIKRFLRSDEIQQEIEACDKALGDAMQMFSISIQIRLLREFKRFARERQQQLETEHEVQMQRRLNDSPTTTLPTCPDFTPRVRVQALPEPEDIIPAASLSVNPQGQDPTLSASQSTLPQPTNATPNEIFFSPLTELQRLLSTENASDMEQDRALFHVTLQSGINAQSDAEMLRVLEVSPGEAPEALKALRRAEASCREREASAGHAGAAIGGLEREFMESGIEALTRLSSVAVQRAGDRDGDVPWDLPPWTITRYEADRLIMIGSGSFSKVYLGTWSGRRVAIKVLSSYTPASLFRQEVEIWRKLRHENVLRMWGASSAQGDRPWFIVSEYCGGGSLIGWLRERKAGVSGSDLVGPSSPPTAGTRREVDLLRCMHHISRGMMYLHNENVLHGDLKASNVLVSNSGRCVISDFGQSEMKWEVSRRSGKPITNGTLRWQAPELLKGATQLTPATDVYAFSICCVEILGMGDLPYGHRDDKLVALLVLDQDKRAEIPSTRFTALTEPLIRECWARDPRQRPVFTHIAARLKQLRKRQGGVEESSVPMRPELQMCSSALSQLDHHSLRMRLPELPRGSASPSEGVQVTPASSGTKQASDPLSNDTVQTSATSGWSPYHQETTANPDTGIVEMPTTRHSGIVVYTPSRLSCMGESDATSTLSSEFTSSPLEGGRDYHARHTHSVGAGFELALPLDGHLGERRNECRFRSLMQSRHGFHHSLTLPLWSPSHVELGAVGYHSKPKGQFITLFNAMQPHQTSGSKITTIPSLGGYGPIQTGKKFDSRLTVTQKGRNLISGLLTFGLMNDGTYSEHISRRHSFPLRAGHKAAYIYAESTMYQFIKDLAAPKEWFKANVNAVVKEYAPHHPIQKEDVIVVVGTLCAPEYALFVSHSHPNGQAHFNVFSDRKSGGRWGTFTTDTEYPSDEGGPSYIEEIPPKAMFDSKVSPVCLNAGSDDKDWDTLMLARLRIPTDATEPTLQ